MTLCWQSVLLVSLSCPPSRFRADRRPLGRVRTDVLKLQFFYRKKEEKFQILLCRVNGDHYSGETQEGV